MTFRTETDHKQTVVSSYYVDNPGDIFREILATSMEIYLGCKNEALNDVPGQHGTRKWTTVDVE